MTLIIFCILLFAPAVHAANPIEIKGSNGAVAWLMEDHLLPIVTLRILYEDSGAARDPQGKEGLATFAVRMLGEGAGDMDELAFNRALDSRAIRFTGDAGEDGVDVGLQTLSESKEEAFRLMDLALYKPQFDDAALERTRAGLLSEIRERQGNPDYIASLTWKEHAFAHHPYSAPRYGTLASVASITRADIMGFMQSRFFCRQRRIAVVGDISPGEVRKWLESIPAAACPASMPALADIAPAAGGDAPVVVAMPVSQTVINASLPGMARSDKRYYAAHILSYIMGGDSILSRLGHEIRGVRGLAYYAEMNLENLDHAPVLSVHFATRSDKAADAVKVFRDQLAKAAKGGVTAEEIKEAKSYLIGSFPLHIDNQGDLAATLVAMQHDHLGIDYLSRRESLINAVTLEEVNTQARELLSKPPLIVMVGEISADKKQ